MIGLGVGVNRRRFAGGFAGSYSSRVIADGGTIEALDCVAAASSLLQSASLLIIPSGYKAGVAYAELPSNGNGDLTWSRNSVANRTQSNGNIGSVAANVPRLSYMYGSCPALLLEPQRTNLLLYSEQIDNAVWNKVSTTVTANAVISPDGTQDAETITISTSDSRVEQTISLGAGTYTFSVYVKVISQTTAGTVRLQGLVDGANVSVNFTPTTEWQRVTATYTAASSLTSVRVRGQSFVGTLAVWGAQLEAGAYATTYIQTTNAAATRLVDTFSRNNIYTNGLISASGGTWYVELRNNIVYTRDTGVVGLFLGDTNTGGTNSLAIRTVGSGTRLSISKLVLGSATTIYTTTTDTVKLALKWNGTGVDIFANGTKVVSASSFTTTLMEFLAHSISGDVPKFIQAMALYSTPLSDADCTLITT